VPARDETALSNRVAILATVLSVVGAILAILTWLAPGLAPRPSQTSVPRPSQATLIASELGPSDSSSAVSINTTVTLRGRIYAHSIAFSLDESMPDAFILYASNKDFDWFQAVLGFTDDSKSDCRASFDVTFDGTSVLAGILDASVAQPISQNMADVSQVRLSARLTSSSGVCKVAWGDPAFLAS
jgi:hypothetical protein